VPFLQFHKLRDLDVDLGSGQDHKLLVHISGRGLPTQQIRSESQKKLWTYGRTDTPGFQSIRSSPGDDLTSALAGLQDENLTKKREDLSE